jgi:hypothetical protein
MDGSDRGFGASGALVATVLTGLTLRCLLAAPTVPDSPTAEFGT